jgi:hypothetical protein
LIEGSVKLNRSDSLLNFFNSIDRHVLLATDSENDVQPSKGKLFHADVEDHVNFYYALDNIGTLVRLWKQGPQVMFAGDMRVRRDQSFSVEMGTGDLVISGVEKGDNFDYESICTVLLYVYDT